MAIQDTLFKVTVDERRRGLCSQCQGHRRLCGKPVCPILAKAETFMKLEKRLSKKNIFGSSPPAVFVGSWNYPKVLAGPLVPPIPAVDSSIMDLPALWIDKPMEEILRYRFTLVRGKHSVDVGSARAPSRFLSTFQEIVMASKPTDTEMWFTKKPRLDVVFSPREPPSGPSASIRRAVLAENPKVPKPVDYVVSDTDLRAVEGVMRLYDSSISQRQITRMLSIGLMGTKRRRRLVPTEWSITAIDDAIGRKIHREILSYPWINQFMVFGHEALANNVQILLFPSSWMFEAQEAWVVSAMSVPGVDHELVRGRKSYAGDLAGAYYAARLPVLEYLRKIRRQAGALVFMEVYPEWIPLGVWRFREICREALRKEPLHLDTLEESLNELRKRLRLPLEKWLAKSQILRWHRRQKRLTSFLA
ncbi:MAG: Nre family DNA repair protein [Candidatus Bathyarchaeota archaeon]|nr:Nre family DNA repair protein [Candidatus Bathyarchaeota archaeon]